MLDLSIPTLSASTVTYRHDKQDATVSFSKLSPLMITPKLMDQQTNLRTTVVPRKNYNLVNRHLVSDRKVLEKVECSRKSKDTGTRARYRPGTCLVRLCLAAWLLGRRAGTPGARFCVPPNTLQSTYKIQEHVRRYLEGSSRMRQKYCC